jgi:hypothetical protein
MWVGLFTAGPRQAASGPPTEDGGPRSAAPSEEEMRTHGRRIPKAPPTMAELAEEWQSKHAGSKEAENFRAKDMQGNATYGGGAAGSASEAMEAPGGIFRRFSDQEKHMDNMEQYHYDLHVGQDVDVTVKTAMAQDSGIDPNKMSSSQMEKATIDPVSEGRMAHNYAGPRTRRPGEGVMELPEMPEGNTTAEKRKAFLDRAGGNPYDIYHGDQIKHKVQGKDGAQPHKVERLMDMQYKESSEMKSFLGHIKLQAGILGPLAPVARHTLDPHENTYAAIRSMGAPLSGDPKKNPIAYVMSDWDWSDRKESVATANMYRSGPTLLAFLSCSVFYCMYDYQVRHDWWDRYYDEYLGLDVRRVEGLENVGIFALTGILINLFLMHPMAIGTVTAIRLFRLKRGRPLGPP